MIIPPSIVQQRGCWSFHPPSSSSVAAGTGGAEMRADTGGILLLLVVLFGACVRVCACMSDLHMAR